MSETSSSGRGSSPRRVAVPVLVKDGKPCGGTETSEAGQVTSSLQEDSHHQQVKSEYVLASSLHQDSVSGVGLGSGPDQPLPPLMHMGYAVSRHGVATGQLGQQPLLQQANMCSYSQHKMNW